MTLHVCRECGFQVDMNADSCPSCRAPRPTDAKWEGTGYEWASKAAIFGIPLIHIAYGRTKTGKRRVAKGFVAIGRYAVGLIAVGQFGVGILFGIGQFMAGLMVLGQFAAGVVTIGQYVSGIYGLCLTGWVKYIWCPFQVDMEAVALYHTLQLRLTNLPSFLIILMKRLL